MEALFLLLFFFILLFFIVFKKSYKLKKENKELQAFNEKIIEDDNKPYRDFTEGHLYENN